ncbi:hypothetical protein E3J74_04050 [Candidatus Bathyarchaeota archaeon]|nr:MAG: hypothetical protein E3J74_04050 [Candidatus Bathyarchaeota archaeon]
MTWEPPIRITKPRLVVVEGKDDLNFFEALIDHMNLQNIQVVECSGKSRLGDYLEALVIASGFHQVTSLGIAVDADDDNSATFESVCAALRGANLQQPPQPLVPIGSNPKVEVMILPRVRENGMLEDLCIESVSSNPATPCMESYFQCLNEHSVFPNELSKAKVHVFLASRPTPDKRLGEAAKAGYWPFGDVAFDQVKDFINQVIS